jgi:hypothetical protein
MSLEARFSTQASTSLMVQTNITRGTPRTMRFQISLGFEFYQWSTHQNAFGLDGMAAMGQNFAHMGWEEQDMVIDEMDEGDLLKAQRSIVLYSGDSMMREITDTEAETDTVLDIPPLNSYGVQNTQGLICEHSEWVSVRTTTVRNHMEEFSKQMGVSIEGFESVVMNLFVEIKKRCRQPRGGGSVDSTYKPKTKKGVIELKNLSTSINYETPKKQGRSRRCRGFDCF